MRTVANSGRGVLKHTFQDEVLFAIHLAPVIHWVWARSVSSAFPQCFSSVCGTLCASWSVPVSLRKPFFHGIVTSLSSNVLKVKSSVLLLKILEFSCITAHE
jgi:hypothetical protein